MLVCVCRFQTSSLPPLHGNPLISPPSSHFNYLVSDLLAFFCLFDNSLSPPFRVFPFFRLPVSLPLRPFLIIINKLKTASVSRGSQSFLPCSSLVLCLCTASDACAAAPPPPAPLHSARQRSGDLRHCCGLQLSNYAEEPRETSRKRVEHREAPRAAIGHLCLPAGRVEQPEGLMKPAVRTRRFVVGRLDNLTVTAAIIRSRHS